MSKTGSAAKVKLNSFDDLFGTEQPQTGTEQVQEIALSELHEFKGHLFKVLDDEKMQETMESIREHGVLMPGIARPMKDAGYYHKECSNVLWNEERQPYGYAGVRRLFEALAEV